MDHTEDKKDLIIVRFISVAKKYSDKPAIRRIRDDGQWESISYGDLLTHAQDCAAQLFQQGVRAGDSVALSTDRSLNLCAQLLGVLWLGANYVFIDPSYPAMRQRSIIDETGAKVGFGRADLSELDLIWGDDAKIVVSSSPSIEGTSESPAYVMFTSGSTGVPKGVVVPQRAINRLVRDSDYIDFSQDHTFLLHSSLNFDASTLEIWGALLNGGTCVIYPKEEMMSSAGLAQVIKEQGVTTLWLTSSFFNLVVQDKISGLAPLQQLLVGGEALSVSHVRKAIAELPNTKLFNGYGPTENTTFTTVYPIPSTLEKSMASLPIGYPINGTQCAAYDQNLKQVGDGEEGELIVFGQGLALGYLNRDDLTAERFVEVTRADGTREKGYRTGDIVVRQDSGSYLYIGRNDKQVKIDGHRIEQGEIEHVLRCLPRIDDARVVMREGPQGQKRLAAYVVTSLFDRAALRAELEESLPAYMIPHLFIEMHSLPVNANGKLNEMALPDPFQIDVTSPSSIMANDILECWVSVLGRTVGRATNFIDAGGTSIEALRLGEVLGKAYDRKLPATFVFEYPTIDLQDRFLGLEQGMSSAVESGASMSNESRTADLAVIGMACRFPGASNIEEYWQNLLDGKESIRYFTLEEMDDIPSEVKSSLHYVPAKGVIDDFDQFDASFFGISPIEANIMDPQHRIMLQLAWHALEDAGHTPGAEGLDAGLFAGANWGRYYQQKVLNNDTIQNRYGGFNAALANEPDFLSTRISYKLNLRGPSVNVYTACSTGLVAVAQACAAIEQGQCDMALAGGVSVSTPVNSGYRYQEGGMLSKDGHCRPFDANASGTTFNDGAGFVVLKRLDLAEKDGDTIHAVVKGSAINNDGSVKASYTAPSVAGQVAVYRSALAKANVDPSTVGYIETHGTATPLGDPIEVAALNKVYGENGYAEKTCVIGSVKSNIGHTIHAAGIASFIKSVCSVRDAVIPGTLFFETANPKLELERTPFQVFAERTEWKTEGLRRAAISSLGVGGTNAHVIVEEYPTARKPGALEPTDSSMDSVESDTYTLAFSAKSEESLRALIGRYSELANRRNVSVKSIAFSASRRPTFDCRMAVSAADGQSLVSALEKVQDARLVKARPDLPRQVVFQFTGQGSQRTQMCSWLYRNDLKFKELFDQGNEILKSEYRIDLAHTLYAEPSPLTDRLSLGIDQTAVAQPALFLIELGVAQWLERKGLKADILVGHSIGEYAAAVMARIMTFTDALRLVACRGRLMQSMSVGSMLAVKSDLHAFEDLLVGGVNLAAANAPGLNVIAGPTANIDKIRGVLDERNIASTPLVTSHAFHSSMMEPMLEEFRAYLSQFDFSDSERTIYSTSTGKKALPGELSSVDYWVEQVRRPVLFSKAVSALSKSVTGGEFAFVEVGPGTTLRSLAGMHGLSELTANVAPLSGFGSSDNAELELFGSLNQLWMRGFSIDWSEQFKGRAAERIALPLYPFNNTRHWLDEPPERHLVAANQVSAALTPSVNAVTKVSMKEVKMSSQEHFSMVTKKLISVFEDVTGYDLSDMDPQAHFSEAGLDSLLLTQIAIALEQEFGGGVTFRHLVEDYTSLKELADFYAELIPIETTSISVPLVPTVSQETASFSQGVTVPVSPIDPTGNPVVDLVNAQLNVMQMQLQALGVAASGTTVSVTQTAASATSSNTEISSTADSNEQADGKARSRHAPGAKIAKESIGVNLSSAQKEWVDRQLTAYQEKYAGSKAYAQEHRAYLADPRTVSGFNPDWKEIVFQIVTKASKGSKLWDIDGNELIDITNGFGPILFGHSPDFITEAVKQQIDKGIETGPSSPIAGEVAKLFCELTGNERCSFASTGSEAVMGAVRLARTVTGRKTVVMFEGAYHGIFDEFIVRPGRDYQALPAAPGILKEMTSNMLVLPWGDPDSIDVIRELGDSLAAVLVEAVQSRQPGFHDASYIHQLRSVTKESDSALILDEVVTGFRVAPGGIRERFDVDADLATYGKVVGGGYPIGIIGGKAKFMDALDGGYWQFGDDSIPEVGVTFFAGTFVRHPISLAAAKAVMTRIKEQGQRLYDELEAKTSELSAGASQFIEEMNCEVKFESFASLFYISVPAAAHWGHLMYVLMMQEGINIQQYRPSFLTTEHSPQDVEKVLNAFKKSLAQMIEHGLIEGDMLAAKKYLRAKPEIPEGARLGKNAQGEPAYFIEDPENQGQYIEVGKP